MLRILSAIALVGTSKAAFDSTTPIVSMADYSKDTRSLDCWQCFQADGFMCHDEVHASQIKATGSSNRAHGVCCKPGFTGEHCNSDATHTCSQPASGAGAGDAFSAVLTKGKNYQLFAYCPSTGNQKTCGIGTDDKNLDMTLTAKIDTQTIKLSGDGSLSYNAGSPDTRKHDSCFYLIVADPAAKVTGPNQKYLNVAVKKISQANAYLYGGKSKLDSKISVVTDNAALTEGATYTFDASVGGFLVAYPNKDQATNFEFTYWLGSTPPAPMGSGGSMGMIIGIVVAVLVLILILVAIMKIRKNKADNQVTNVLVNEDDNANDKTKNDDVGVVELPAADKKPEETEK